AGIVTEGDKEIGDRHQRATFRAAVRLRDGDGARGLRRVAADARAASTWQHDPVLQHRGAVLRSDSFQIAGHRMTRTALALTVEIRFAITRVADDDVRRHI